MTRRERSARRIKAAGSRLAGISAPKARVARTYMSRLAPRAKALLLYADGDPGIKPAEAAFGVNRAPPGAVFRIVRGIDHGLSTEVMRGIVISHVVSFIEQDFDSRDRV